MNPELSPKWWQFWIKQAKPVPVEPQRVTVMEDESWYPDLEQQGSPWADQRARFLKQRNEGGITMGQYHSAVDISRLAEADMITLREAEVRFKRLFPLKELD